MTKKVEYGAILFRQRAESPVQVAFVAASAEIDSWARVPTRRTGNIRNFQRAEIGRHVKEVSHFFKDEHNASPTAIVVGFDPIRSKGRTELVVNGQPVSVNDIKPGIPQSGLIRITWDEASDPVNSSEFQKSILSRKVALDGLLYAELKEISNLSEKTITLLAKEFNSRALEGKSKLSDAAEASDGADDLDEDDAQGLEDADTDDVIGELTAESSATLQGLTPSERQVVVGRLEFLANIQPSLLASMTDEALKVLHSEVEDELKPGILIDGQHRVMGTRMYEDIPFLVCALPDTEWPELAFQFIVTNRTARRVQESLLINIVGNSLSKAQRASIESRLRDAGIRVGLIEAIMKVNEDETSPFYKLLSFGIKNESGFLDAAAMRTKVVQIWYERKPPVRQLFDHFCEGKTTRDKTDFWKSEEKWFAFFTSFWSAVRDRYEGSDVFSTALTIDDAPVSKLMSATVLKIFQETVLQNIFEYVSDKLTKEDVPVKTSIKSEKAFSLLVQKTLKPLTPEFFQGWNITGFDGSKGAKEDLEEAIQLVLSGDSKVADLKSAKSPHRLFKEHKK